MKLFKYEGYRVIISEEAFALKPFRKIWERDKTSGKKKAVAELGFIYFFCDPRSDYQYIIDEEDRLREIREGEGLPSDWRPDKEVKEAIKFYNSFKSSSALLLEDTRAAVDKLRKMLREIDLYQLDDKGKPIYTLNMVTSTIKQIPELISELDKAEKAMTSDMTEKGKMRGSGEKTIFEDGLNI